MTESKAHPRPRQVTVAAGMAAVSCVLLVVALFDAMAQTRTPETRDTVAEWLSRPPGNGLGIDVQQAVGILRGVVLFNGALAAAAFVLAIFTLQRHNGARIAFTVAAAVLLFTAPLSGGVLPMVAAASAVLLWSAPARDWFAGREPRPARPEAERAQATEPLRREQLEPSRPVTLPTEQPQQPQPVQQPGPSAHPFGAPQPQMPPVAPPGYGYPQQPSPGGSGKRPASVTAAAWLTWAFAGVTVGLYALMLIALVALRDQVLTALRQDPGVSDLDISGNDLIAALWVVGVVVVFWCLSAMVLAFFVTRRMNWARIVLTVSTAFAAVFALFAAFTGALVSLLLFLACLATIVLLFLPDSNAWFAGRPPSRPAPPTYGGPGYGQPQQPQQPPPDRSADQRPDVW